MGSEGELRSSRLGWRGSVRARAVPVLLSLQVISSLQQLDPGRGGSGAPLLVGAAWRGRSGDGAMRAAWAGCSGARSKGGLVGAPRADGVSPGEPAVRGERVSGSKCRGTEREIGASLVERNLK